jgi:hypothetical protein
VIPNSDKVLGNRESDEMERLVDISSFKWGPQTKSAN